MNKPYIICYMMTAVDGRIDCAMTEHLPSVEEYYSTLNSLDALKRLSGRITAELEMSLPGKFYRKSVSPLGHLAFHQAAKADGYEIVVDTQDTLLWNDQSNEKHPVLVLTSENVSVEYLDYLKEKHISYIACGKENIDLKCAREILADKFSINRMAVVGGGHINVGFLAEGLLDEIRF